MRLCASDTTQTHPLCCLIFLDIARLLLKDLKENSEPDGRVNTNRKLIFGLQNTVLHPDAQITF